MAVKSLIHRALHCAGFDLIRYDAAHSEDARLRKMLLAHQVNLIFDIGANIGQFGRHLRQIGYEGRIVSFEPLSAAWAQLRRASASDGTWEVAPRCAIGSEDGEIEIHIAGNSYSSSALNMLDSHLNAAPDSKYVGIERTPLRCLNTIGPEYLHSDSILFIKIDTQGFEGPVLQGATELLKIAVGLHLELSLVPLYENQRLFDSLTSELQSLGFEMWNCVPCFHDPRSGRALQVDATFFRRQNRTSAIAADGGAGVKPALIIEPSGE
jgi:FkbM family methyltransferase